MRRKSDLETFLELNRDRFRVWPSTTLYDNTLAWVEARGEWECMRFLQHNPDGQEWLVLFDEWLEKKI